MRVVSESDVHSMTTSERNVHIPSSVTHVLFDGRKMRDWNQLNKVLQKHGDRKQEVRVGTQT